jgi:hypothetical protein
VHEGQQVAGGERLEEVAGDHKPHQGAGQLLPEGGRGGVRIGDGDQPFQQGATSPPPLLAVGEGEPGLYASGPAC